MQMKRTPIDQRELPDYTRGEEIMNMVTHIVGGGIGVIVLILGVVLAARRRDAWSVVSVCEYALGQLPGLHLPRDGHQADVNQVGTTGSAEVGMSETENAVTVVIVAATGIPRHIILGFGT